MNEPELIEIIIDLDDEWVYCDGDLIAVGPAPAPAETEDDE